MFKIFSHSAPPVSPSAIYHQTLIFSLGLELQKSLVRSSERENTPFFSTMDRDFRRPVLPDALSVTRLPLREPTPALFQGTFWGWQGRLFHHSPQHALTPPPPDKEARRLSLLCVYTNINCCIFDLVYPCESISKPPLETPKQNVMHGFQPRSIVGNLVSPRVLACEKKQPGQKCL